MVNFRRIFGVGETVLDVIFKNDQPMAAVPGGSAFNAMISLGRSIGFSCPDIPIKMITETGDDHIGDIVVNFMHDNNVATDCVTRNKETQTHLSMAFLNEINDAHYEFYKDHAHASLDPNAINNLVFKKDDILLTSSFFSINPVIRDFTRVLFEKAHDAGAILYYDVNFRSSHIAEIPEVMDNILENFRLCDIVRGSTEDFQNLFETSNPQEVYERYIVPCENIETGHSKIFICTDGGNPITLITPTFTAKYPVQKIDTVSTIGAGDNFNAGIICGVVENKLTKIDLQTADWLIWDKLIESGLSFSSEVCQSIYNYISCRSK